MIYLLIATAASGTLEKHLPRQGKATEKCSVGKPVSIRWIYTVPLRELLETCTVTVLGKQSTGHHRSMTSTGLGTRIENFLEGVRYVYI